MNTTQPNTVNGVDVNALTTTVKAIQAEPAIAGFRFRATNRAIEGGLNRSEIGCFYGARQEQRTERAPFVLENDEPPVLLSKDQAPNPVEYVIHGLLGCMTTTTLYKAAAHGIEIESMRSEVEGDLDLQGMLGLDPDVRPGYQEIRARLIVKTKGDRETVRGFHRSSPVFDTLARPVPIKVEVVFED
ncbi:MAG: OsmC family peroxiredoxin [Puniceicoccaceae bacterium]|nr:MAG: OsmC family peroxiredoxin [Puniceicoccaceae bacterium]